MEVELKRAIINWLLDHKNEWQRLNSCRKEFRNYIYDEEGNYLIGSEKVRKFILDAEKLLFEEENS